MQKNICPNSLFLHDKENSFPSPGASTAGQALGVVSAARVPGTRSLVSSARCFPAVALSSAGLGGWHPPRLGWTLPRATRGPAFTSGAVFSSVTRGCGRTPWGPLSCEGQAQGMDTRM